MKLFRGTAKYLQKTLTFRRNTIVGVFFVYLLWEIFKQLWVIVKLAMLVRNLE